MARRTVPQQFGRAARRRPGGRGLPQRERELGEQEFVAPVHQDLQASLGFLALVNSKQVNKQIEVK